MIAEAAIGDNAYPDRRGQGIRQTDQHLIFVVIPPVLQRGRIDGEPHKRGGATMAGQQRQHDGRLPVGIKVGPVHRHVDAGAGSHHVGHPVTQCRIDVDPLIGQHPVDLLDSMLGHQATRLGEPQADYVDRQGRGRDHAKGGVGQREDPLGVQTVAEQTVEEAVHLLEANGLGGCHALALRIDVSARANRKSHGRGNQSSNHDRR